MDYLNCVYCGMVPSREESYSTCSICKTARYCCRECQKKDWKKHKTICVYNVDTHMIDKIKRFMYNTDKRSINDEFRIELDMIQRLGRVPVINFRCAEDIQEFISVNRSVKGFLRSTSMSMNVLDGEEYSIEEYRDMLLDGYLLILVYLNNIHYPVYVPKIVHPERVYVGNKITSTPAIQRWIRDGGSVRYTSDVTMTDEIALTVWTLGILRKGKERYGTSKESVVKIISTLVGDTTSIQSHIDSYLSGNSAIFSAGGYRFAL